MLATRRARRLHRPSSPPLATPPPPVIPSPLPPSIIPAPAPPSSSSSTAPPVGEGGTVVSPSVMITDEQCLVTEQLQDQSSMDGVHQSGGQETGEQQTGEQQIGEEQIGEEQIGEQQTGEPQIGKQQMWGIRDVGRVLVSGTITAPPLRRSTRITRGVPPVKYTWAVVIEPAGLDDEEEDEGWTDLDPNVVADPKSQWDIAKMTVKEALGCWKGDKVKEAMDEEMRSLIDQGIWELNAFLHSVLDRDLYMEQPSYYEDGSPRVCKLEKSLYGLKQSPMLWYEALDGELLGAGWKKSQVDESLYFKSDAKGEMCWLLVYVDDLLAASRSQSMPGELRDLLQSAFQLRAISPVEKYLGLQLVRDRPTRRLWLHQGAYVDKSRQEEYRQKVGSLQFAACTIRPDISFACSKLGLGQTVRSDPHCKELDQCLAYLVGSRDVALEFGGGPESLELVGYADADDAGDKQNMTSTGGYVFVLGCAAVSRANQRIRCATLSSTESEYVAAVEAGKEARRLRFLLVEFQLLRSEEPTTLFVDNSSAISVAGSDFSEIDYVLLADLGSACPKLTQLELYGGSYDRSRVTTSTGLDALFTSCTALQTLVVDTSDKIEWMPSSFFNLSSLTDVNLNFHLREFPDAFGELKSLTKLKLEKLLIKDIPESFGQLTALTEIDISKCILLYGLPDTFGNLCSLKKLTIYYSRSLEVLPGTLGQLQNLKEATLYGNESLLQLPPSFYRLPSLKDLKLWMLEDLKDLDSEVSNLVSLEELSIDMCCQFSSLPASLCTLPNLRSLGISDCKLLTHLPQSIGDLTSLNI
ncbi:unnamed protein product [Closterium sp. NIES-54]